MMIRKATLNDAQFCHGLTVLENWGHTLDEIAAVVTNRSADFFIAEDTKPTGMVASFQYGRAAWIGLLIVSKEYRYQGIGTALMEKALKTLKSRGVTTVRLEAVSEAVPLYKRLGFTPEFDSLRLRGEFHGAKLPQSNISEKMVEDIAVFDQNYFGANRKILLENFLALSSVRLVEIDTSIKGYLFARTGSLTTVGPCVCENEKIFESLLTQALSQVKGPVSVGIPDRNKLGVSLLEQYGFTVVGSSLRMVWGKKRYTGIPERIYAIGAPEKG